MTAISPTRLFVALLPTDPVRDALSRLRGDLARARWTPPAQFHLTLRFIGEVQAEEQARIEAALGTVRVQPFFLALEGTGQFPPRGHPSVIWAGVDGHPHLHQLRQQVDDQLLTTGVPIELRPFVPHFTVALTADSPAAALAHWLKRERDFAGPAWRVDAFHLLASELSPAGAVHRIVRTFPLARREP